jgi:hypothetical protein
MAVSHAKESLVGSSRRSSFIEEEEIKLDKKVKKKFRKNCCMNCKSMATERTIPDQNELFDQYTKHYRSTVTLNDAAGSRTSSLNGRKLS